jgi:hypothetical protein
VRFLFKGYTFWEGTGSLVYKHYLPYNKGYRCYSVSLYLFATEYTTTRYQHCSRERREVVVERRKISHWQEGKEGLRSQKIVRYDRHILFFLFLKVDVAQVRTGLSRHMPRPRPQRRPWASRRACARAPSSAARRRMPRAIRVTAPTSWPGGAPAPWLRATGAAAHAPPGLRPRCGRLCRSRQGTARWAA